MDKTPSQSTDGTPLTAAQPDPWLGMVSDAWDMLVLGGPVVALLIAMSVFALAITVIKLWQFHAMRVSRLAGVRRAVELKRAERAREALACVQGDRNPVAQTLARALRGHIRGDLAAGDVRAEAERFGKERLEAMRAYLRPLEVIASLAPLLGLFGTVLGMITAFQQMEAAGSQVNPAVLSGGIWEALLTTAVGLAVAIPSVAILNWLERIAERTEVAMADAIAQVFAPDLLTMPTLARTEPDRLADPIGAD